MNDRAKRDCPEPPEKLEVYVPLIRSEELATLSAWGDEKVIDKRTRNISLKTRLRDLFTVLR